MRINDCGLGSSRIARNLLKMGARDMRDFLKLMALISTFIFTLFVTIQVARILSIPINSTVGGIVIFSIACAAMFVVGNIAEGRRMKEILNDMGEGLKGFGVLALSFLFIAALIWGAASIPSFVSSTPTWALIIIVLLTLILLSKR